MESLELQATASTIRATRAAECDPIELLRVVSAMPGKRAFVKIAAVGNGIELVFRFPSAAAGWAKSLVCSCEFLSIYSFGKIAFTDGDQLKSIDPTQFELVHGSSTTADVLIEGPTAEESISVSIEEVSRSRALLAVGPIESFLRDNSWLGCPRAPAVVAVDLSVLAIHKPLRTRHYPIGAVTSHHQFEVDGSELHVTCHLGEGNTDGKIRHAKYGIVGSAREIAKIPDGLVADLIFHIDPEPQCLFEVRAITEFRIAKQSLSRVLDLALQSEAAKRLRQGITARSAQLQLALLEDRRNALKQSELVCAGKQPVHRVPRNEMDLVCLFNKLAVLRETPFECQILEYTAKKGIDALGRFRLSDEMVWEEDVPIEFEYLFESFAAHKHPVGHVKLIVCWDVGEPDAPELHATEFAWLIRYDCGAAQIPVAVVSRFPKVKVRGAKHA